MKMTFYMAILVMLFSSCTKDPYTIPGPVPPPPTPILAASIYPYVTEPRQATLGDPSSIFSVGEYVTVYVQYEATNEQVSGATLSVLDELGEVLESYDMAYTNNMATGVMSMPQSEGQEGNGFYAATIELKDLHAGKTLTLRTQVNGNYLTAVHEVPYAFSVNAY